MSRWPTVLAADADWLWLAKPAGLPVFPPHRDPAGDSLLRWLLAARPQQALPSFPEGFAGGLAHRLDTATSGVVLAARTPETLGRARLAFREKRLLKTYRLLSAGRVPWRENTVSAELAHHRRRRGRMVVRRGRETPHRGRWYPAETQLRAVSPGLWEAQIRSGVTHQVRLHAAFAGLAILGDRRYGGAPMPPDLAPAGADFALHHLGFTGLVDGAPRLAPPGWWGGWSTAGGR